MKTPSRIYLSYAQQRDLEDWLNANRARIEGESWGVERIAVEATSALNYKVTTGNLRTVMNDMRTPLRLASANSSNFFAPLQRQVDELERQLASRLALLESDATEQSLRVDSMTGRLNDALDSIANLEGELKRLAERVRQTQDQVGQARKEVATAMETLGFRKLDASVTRAAFQALAAEAKAEPK